MKYFKWMILFSASCFLVTACGSKSGGGSTTSNKTTLTYYESDGVCYRASDNSKASSSSCSSLKYGIDRGVCVDAKGNEVAMSKCTKNAYVLGDNGCYDSAGKQVDEVRCYENGEPGGKDNSQAGVCKGDHLQWRQEGNDYIPYVGTCDGKVGGNCSGWILFNLETRQWVDCK